MSELTAIILAGGKGTRLRKAVSDRPKTMAKVINKPFIIYLLDQLINHKINSVIISTGYMANLIENEIGYEYKGLQIQYSQEYEPLGTAGALKLAAKIVMTNQCIVLNGDSYIEVDFKKLLLFHDKIKANITLVVKKVIDCSRFGTLEVDKKDSIIKFSEKRNTKNPGYINTGVYLVEKPILNKLSDKKPYSLEYEFLPSLIGNNLFAYQTIGEFIDIGIPESYERAGTFFNELEINRK
jgi:D-glycero-alpha-D-manno-heptose 1-phosphate guanylyltransferase